MDKQKLCRVTFPDTGHKLRVGAAGAAYSLWLHFQICYWWDLGQYWGNTAARKFKAVTLRVSQTKWAHREKKNPQHDSDIGCESLHFVFLLPSIRMHFLFSHLALPSAHTPALHIPSSSPAANADGSSQQQATAEGDVIHVFPPRAIKRAPAGTRVVQWKHTRPDETLGVRKRLSSQGRRKQARTKRWV